MRTNRGYLLTVCYSKGVSTYNLAETQRPTWEWESFVMKKNKKRCSAQRLLPWGSWRQAKWKQDILCDGTGEHIWLSLVNPKSEVEAKIGKLAGINQVLILWAVCCRVIVWVPEFGAAEVLSQSSFVIRSLAIVHLYIQSFSLNDGN